MADLTSKKIFEHTFKEPINAEDFDIQKYISYDHEQDCCENVYIDMEHIDLYKPMIQALKEIVKFEIWTAPEDWIIVFVYAKDDDRRTNERIRYWIYLPCRNEQNGFYSSNLEIIVTIDDIVHKIDISDNVYDYID